MDRVPPVLRGAPPEPPAELAALPPDPPPAPPVELAALPPDPPPASIGPLVPMAFESLLLHAASANAAGNTAKYLFTRMASD
jgi:hypothetical protein